MIAFDGFLGLFGHHHQSNGTVSGGVESGAASWYHVALAWASSHWQVLAVVIPVAGAIAGGILNHYLAVARENRSRRLQIRDVRARVHADLAARLLRHCSRMHAALANGTLDVQTWSAENAGLHARAQQPDVVDALAGEYVAFMAAIEHERRSVSAGDPRRALEAYVPFISAFGEPAQARRLQKMLRS
ncbi:MAG: hypothetical protein JO199_10565 [Candidatus Eremiobacteraeota bacterium]|nr:hypothetical protein [Candidatus Eremiobacteraeota bacterium]